MKFFLDNCIAPAIARAIQEVGKSQGIEVAHLSDLFPRDIKDVDWLTQLGQQGGWIIVSADPRIIRNKAEKAAWKESQQTAFFLEGGFASRHIWVQVAELVRWWPVIMQTAADAPAGSGYLLPFKGTRPKPIF